MECPRCGNRVFHSIKRVLTFRGVERYRFCDNNNDNKGCGLLVKTIEKINQVSVFNPKTLENQYISLEDYLLKHRDNELIGHSGFTISMFEDNNE